MIAHFIMFSTGLFLFQVCLNLSLSLFITQQQEAKKKRFKQREAERKQDRTWKIQILSPERIYTATLCVQKDFFLQQLK